MTKRRKRRYPRDSYWRPGKIKPPKGIKPYQEKIRSALDIPVDRWIELMKMGKPGPGPIYLCDMPPEVKNKLLYLVTCDMVSKREHKRAQIVLLRNAGMSMVAIKDHTGHSRETLRIRCKRFTEEGLEGLEDLPGRGRNQWLSSAIDVAIVRYVCTFKAERRRKKAEATGKAKRTTEDNETDEEYAETEPFPYSRLSARDIHELLVRDFGEDAPCLDSVYRLLKRRKLKPWLHQNWIHITDPNFWEIASVVLELYAGRYEGKLLGEDEHVLSADEMTQMQVLERIETPAAPGHNRKVGFKYDRHGVLKLHAIRDVKTGKMIYNFVEDSNSEEFKNFIRTMMKLEPYASAKRVFIIVDNGSCHHPSTFGQWLKDEFNGQVVAVHTPANASWLNQIECFFSILVRKALTPRNFKSKELMMKAIDQFIEHYNKRAKPFKWSFSKEDLRYLIDRLEEEGLYPPPRGPLDIEGVGPKLRQTLLDAFGSEEAFMTKTYDEICNLDGFGPTLAQRAIDHLSTF